jgi:hypothetical protein
MPNPHGNPLFTKGNRMGLRNKGNRDRPSVKALLDRFAPRVMEIIDQRLTTGDEIDQWQTAKELMPLFMEQEGTATSSSPYSREDACRFECLLTRSSTTRNGCDRN